MENPKLKCYYPDRVFVNIETPEHGEYIILSNSYKIIDDKIVVPISKIRQLSENMVGLLDRYNKQGNNF